MTISNKENPSPGSVDTADESSPVRYTRGFVADLILQLYEDPNLDN